MQNESNIEDGPLIRQNENRQDNANVNNNQQGDVGKKRGNEKIYKTEKNFPNLEQANVFLLSMNYKIKLSCITYYLIAFNFH